MEPNSTKLRIVCVSDTHSKHNKIELPEGDILIHAGDFSGRSRLREVKRFSKWIKSTSFKYKIVISGNHDLCFDETIDLNTVKKFQDEKCKDRQKIIDVLLQDNQVIYLQDSSVDIEGYKFYGTP